MYQVLLVMSKSNSVSFLLKNQKAIVYRTGRLVHGMLMCRSSKGYYIRQRINNVKKFLMF